jgi:hypothetical protein
MKEPISGRNMHSYNLISADSIIGRTLDSFGITDRSFRARALEWIGDGIGLIGYAPSLINKHALIEVTDNTIVKPDHFFSLNSIYYNGQRLLYGYNPNRIAHNSSPTVSNEFNEVIQLIQAKENSIRFADGEIDADGCEPNYVSQYNLLDTNELDRVDNRIKILLDQVKVNSPASDSEYFLDSEGNCYKTSFDNGHVIMFYKSYPIDERGYPMVIDEVKYKTALEYVVMERLMRRGKTHAVLSYGDVRNEMWKWIGKASNEHKKFNDSELRTFTKHWTSMIFQVQQSDDYYSNG